MKHQTESFGLIRLPVCFDIYDLAWRNEYKGPFLIVIIITTILQITAIHFLEKDTIEPKCQTDLFVPIPVSGVRLRKIDHTDQRMHGFMLIEAIVLTDSIKSVNLTHNAAFG